MSKGIDYLVEAVPEIVKENPDGVLVFNLIHAKRDKEMKQKIQEISNRVGGYIHIFDGFSQQELRELIATADLVIAPSLAEGFGSVHSETCAMKKTLVTTQVAAIPEVVSGNVKFIQPCSSESIVQGIREVRKGKSVRIAKKEFDRDESVKRLEELYG
ncbi:MAG: glycosyltransferase family 4 protein [Candidatus Peribacteria bacterium]|jgi:glycosyltransferase involved in cell wall biosynthesis|nr:glycosyltransferase family 4 protein [Candidatus Peribacteria bacterium]